MYRGFYNRRYNNNASNGLNRNTAGKKIETVTGNHSLSLSYYEILYEPQVITCQIPAVMSRSLHDGMGGGVAKELFPFE